jgi:hypothetical protein
MVGRCLDLTIDSRCLLGMKILPLLLNLLLFKMSIGLFCDGQLADIIEGCHATFLFCE